MARTKTRRKANTAMVYNPSRGLSIGGARRTSVRRSAARKNPRRITAAARVKANPARRRFRRRSNPITSVSALLFSAVMAGIGVSVFDVATTRFLPQQSAALRIGIKAGGAWAVNSYGSKLPILGKYKSEIALVLLTSAAVDAMKLWVLPLITQAVPSLNLLVAAPAAGSVAGDAGTTGNLYGNAPTGASNVYRYM